jgi:hypothetical protein
MTFFSFSVAIGSSSCASCVLDSKLLHVSWIRNLNYVLFVVKVLIKGEIEKPSGQYLGLIVMSH